MAYYVKESLTNFIADTAIKDTVLKDNPVPLNIQEIKKMDTSFREERGLYIVQKQDRNLAKCQNMMIVNVFGPLSKLWTELELARGQPDKGFRFEDTLKLVEQTITEIGQSFVPLSGVSTIEDCRKQTTIEDCRKQSFSFGFCTTIGFSDFRYQAHAH